MNCFAVFLKLSSLLLLLVVLRALVEQNVTGETALAALGVMLVSVTGAAVFWYLAHNSEGQANYHMCEEKRIRIGERMKYMPMGYFNSQSLGSLTAAATSTMEDLESMSFAVIARTMVGIIRTVVFSIAILFFDWRIGLIFLLGVLLFLFVNSQLLKKSRQLSPGRLQAQTKLVDSVLEYIQGMSVVRAFHGDKAANQTLNKNHRGNGVSKTLSWSASVSHTMFWSNCVANCCGSGCASFYLAIFKWSYDFIYLLDDGDFRFSCLQRA